MIREYRDKPHAPERGLLNMVAELRAALAVLGEPEESIARIAGRTVAAALATCVRRRPAPPGGAAARTGGDDEVTEHDWSTGGS